MREAAQEKAGWLAVAEGSGIRRLVLLRGRTQARGTASHEVVEGRLEWTGGGPSGASWVPNNSLPSQNVAPWENQNPSFLVGCPQLYQWP